MSDDLQLTPGVARLGHERTGIALLDFEPSLAACVAPEQRELARRALRVTVLRIPRGPWQAPPIDPAESFGFLIGSGVLVREVRLDGSRSLEPLGPGDLLRPWQDDAASFAEGELQALTPARIAVCDREFAVRAARFPRLIADLMERVMARSRYLAVYAAIDGLVGVKKRLVAVMWTLAERWGSLRDGEIFLPVEFHHSTLAYLIAARRPSVSTAISELQRDGTLERVDGGWLVRGEPPAALR